MRNTKTNIEDMAIDRLNLLKRPFIIINPSLIKIISKIMKNKYVKFEPLELAQYVKDRKGHDFRYAISNKKINNDLNWFPKYNFRSAIELTINWYYQNHFKKL